MAPGENRSYGTTRLEAIVLLYWSLGFGRWSFNSFSVISVPSVVIIPVSKPNASLMARHDVQAHLLRRRSHRCGTRGGQTLGPARVPATRHYRGELK